ncbi:MAG: formate hydrogenlyase subunit 6/NADH:ubiquinone oxidoreductase subunit I [Sphingobacteriales bacterium]
MNILRIFLLKNQFDILSLIFAVGIQIKNIARPTMPQKTSTIYALLKGLKISISHFNNSVFRKKTTNSSNYYTNKGPLATIQYPKEKIPVPEVGRYKLHNEIDDCIVCDLCAKICPVNCIEIDTVRATEEIGKTSDGTSKRIHALKFDIDMDKCMFCGLCTTVCPTECLTMLSDYDYSVEDKQDFTFEFGNLSDSEKETKVAEWKKFEDAKAKK